MNKHFLERVLQLFVGFVAGIFTVALILALGWRLYPEGMRQVAEVIDFSWLVIAGGIIGGVIGFIV